MRLASALSLVVWASVLGLIGWFFYEMHERRQEEMELKAAIARLTEEKQCAKVIVDAIDEDPRTGEKVIHMRWADTDAQGKGLPGAQAKSLVVRGEEAYFDTWQIIFDKKDIQEGDPLRGHTLTLFHRVYGSDQKPSEGLLLNVPPGVAGGTPASVADEDLVPSAFRQGGDEPTELERRLWRRFWDLCRDPELARQEGVRTAQGTAVHKPMVEGKQYRLTIDRAGQILLEGPEEPDPFVPH